MTGGGNFTHDIPVPRFLRQHEEMNQSLLIQQLLSDCNNH